MTDIQLALVYPFFPLLIVLGYFVFESLLDSGSNDDDDQGGGGLMQPVYATNQS